MSLRDTCRRANPLTRERVLWTRALRHLDEKIARAAAAREAIAHGLRRPHEDVTGCPTFEAGVTARLSGRALARFHQELHAPP